MGIWTLGFKSYFIFPPFHLVSLLLLMCRGSLPFIFPSFKTHALPLRSAHQGMQCRATS